RDPPPDRVRLRLRRHALGVLPGPHRLPRLAAGEGRLPPPVGECPASTPTCYTSQPPLASPRPCHLATTRPIPGRDPSYCPPPLSVRKTNSTPPTRCRNAPLPDSPGSRPVRHQPGPCP